MPFSSLCFIYLSFCFTGLFLPSAMVAPHLTACMRSSNDKLGDPSSYQNQTMVCSCPLHLSPPISLSPVSLFLSLSRCVLWPQLTRTVPLLSMHKNPFTQNAFPIPPPLLSCWLVGMDSYIPHLAFNLWEWRVHCWHADAFVRFMPR